jgi:uncharacterized protein YndB with AHSA1/START domain
MSVQKDASGRRFVKTEVEVPGSLEQVWKAIATGPGMSSWFVPCKSEERVGGQTSAEFGPGMEAVGTITEWDPPHRHAHESADLGEYGPAMATEWTVEAVAGGACIVRVVHRWFSGTDQWDEYFESIENGWPAFFRILRLYMTHFPGKEAASFVVVPPTELSYEEAWQTLLRELGLSDFAEGQEFRTADGSPVLAGRVEGTGTDTKLERLLLLSEPAPGVAHLMSMDMGGQAYLAARVFFYGEGAQERVDRETPVWEAWLAERFSAPTG